MGIQQMNDGTGKMVEVLDREFDVPYYEIETFTHVLRKPKEALGETKLKVQELRKKKKYIEADQKAEKYIRGGTKPKRLMPRDTAQEGQMHAWSVFKKQIFGYDQLTKKQQMEELTGENQKLKVD